MKKTLTLCLLSAVFASLFSLEGVSAQSITHYTFSAVSGSFTPLTGATVSTTYNTDQGFYTAIPIGFDFVYMGAIRRVLNASTNGWATFEQQSFTFDYGSNLISHATRPILAPLWGDLEMGSGSFSYKTESTEPNRIFTAEWLNAKWYAYASAPSISFQLKCYESTGVVEFVYRQEAGAVNSGAASIGIAAEGTGAGNFLSLNGTGTSPSASSTTETNTLSTRPATGQIYRFTPPTLTAPTSLNFISIGATVMTLSWQDNSSNETAFYVYRSDDGGSTYNYVGSAAANATSSVQTGLVPSTTYYWRVAAVTEGAVSSMLQASQATAAPSLSGTRTVGPTGNYATLTAALADIHLKALSGPLVLELQSGYVSTGETFPITFSNLTTSATNTLTIRPASGATGRVISANDYRAAIDLNGATYVTLDGRPGGSGSARELTIANAYSISTGPAVRFINGASYDTLHFLILQGATLYYGVIDIDGTTGGSGNSYNTIDSCDIRDGASKPAFGIYSSGQGSGKENRGNTIANCRIFNFYSGSQSTAGIGLLYFNTDWTIKGNSFYQTSYTSGGTLYGIRILTLSTGDHFSVTGNYIGGSMPNAAGTWSTNYSTFIGIEVNVGTTNPSSIQNNTIANFSGPSSNTTAIPGSWCGIHIIDGKINIGDSAGNTIGTGLGTGSISYTAGASLYFGIVSESSSNITISNNTIGGFTLLNGSGFASSRFTGIEVTAGTVTILSNCIGSPSVTNSIIAGPCTASLSGGQTLYGIYCSASSAVISDNLIANLTNGYSGTEIGQTAGMQIFNGVNTVTGNTVRNLATWSRGGGGGVSAPLVGINLYDYSYGGQTISGNTIHSLSDSSSVGNAFISGIHYAASSTGINLITKNFVHSFSLSTTNPAAAMLGIDIATPATCANNIVRLGIDANGNSVTRAPYLWGIRCGMAANVYFNSVYLGGTNVESSTAYSSAFERSSSGVADVRDNIFVNNRSNASTGGNHYAVRFSDFSSVTSDYNMYYAAGTGGVLGGLGATDYGTLCAWRTAGPDLNSRYGDPKFLNPTGTNTLLDLHINPGVPSPVENAGVSITSVSDDFDGQTRSGLTPTDIGADAGNFTLLPNPHWGGGGTVADGYYFANSTCEASGSVSQPSYAWIDPVSLGHSEVTSWTSGDPDNGFLGPVSLPFPFTFFGNSYSALYISTNGLISFGSGSLDPNPVSIPTAPSPSNFIAGAWTDLDVEPSAYPDAHIYYGGDTGHFIVTYYHAHKKNSISDFITFQIILGLNGGIKIQYNAAESTAPEPVSITGNCAVGIENSTGDHGIQYRLDGSGGPMLNSSLAVAFGTNQAQLPVELTSFTASAGRTGTSLHWKTATEINNSGFGIERAVVNGLSSERPWMQIGFVGGAGTSNVPKGYTFIDIDSPPGKSSYRLKQIDQDGRIAYSQTVDATTLEAPKDFELAQNYPNPFNPSTLIAYQLQEAGMVRLSLFDMLGREIAVLVNEKQNAGYYSATWNAGNLSSGVYMYRISISDENGRSRLNEAKRMMLVK